MTYRLTSGRTINNYGTFQGPLICFQMTLEADGTTMPTRNDYIVNLTSCNAQTVADLDNFIEQFKQQQETSEYNIGGIFMRAQRYANNDLYLTLRTESTYALYLCNFQDQVSSFCEQLTYLRNQINTFLSKLTSTSNSTHVTTLN